MYKISAPVSIQTMNEESLPVFVAEFLKAGVERIFLCGLTPFYKKDNYLFKEPQKMEYLISYFKRLGFEVGVWESSFGHGGTLSHDSESEYVDSFTRIKGVDGKMAQEAFCPLDEKFRKNYYECIKKVAAMHPDIIMLDDDFRLNTRSAYNMGCCCDKHLRKFYDCIGEEIALEKIEEAVFTGGENPYRTAWLKVMGESLVDFAKLMRKAVDEVDESIRLGCCMCYDTWDYSGTDGIELAKAFAGKTRPFLRTIGAPYHGLKVQNVIEYTRMQANWCRKEDIEIFAEGDVYPRPRYAVESKRLEIFDLGLLASKATDGILKYMFSYGNNVNYEKGYNLRHIKNKWLRTGINEFFKDKKNIGVRVCETMHKAEKFDLPTECKPGVATFVQNTFFSRAQKILSENAIPTVYDEDKDYPVIIFGENARYINENELKNGAILDVVAAKIFAKRGIDTGLTDSCEYAFVSEKFAAEDEEITGFAGITMHKAECVPDADVKSLFMPGGFPATYTYQNSSGLRFYVLLIDAARSDNKNYNYFNNYYRQQHLINAVEWLCGKPLPAVCTENPYLYIQVAESDDKNARSVALFNINIDEVITPEIILDKPYSEIKFLNCSGELRGNVVKLFEDIEPYGFAAFEVK